MPATSPEAIERERLRKLSRRRERRAADPDYSRRETKARAKRARSPASLDRRRQLRERQRQAQDERPFVGCDGEGIGGHDGSDQRYALFRMGSRELYDGDRRLTTPELLRFILEYPEPRDLLVSFAFDYDVNMILKDAPAERWRHLLKLDTATREGERDPFQRAGGWTWLRFPGGAMTFGVQYIPRNYFKVCRGLSIRLPKGEWRTIAAPGSTRTIYDTFANFQSSFLVALNRWSIGAEHWPAIKAGKEGRAAFATITPDVRRYCSIECDLLADMMSAFRSACLAVNIRPKTWNGAGKLAAALMSDHGVMRSAEVEKRLPADLLRMAHEAYYGGRFEVTRCGAIERPVHEHDINSAYPDAMRELPCLEHGQWRKASGAELAKSRGLYVARVAFAHGADSFLCGLPFRSPRDGRLSWPRFGRGVYWSPEIRSARRLGAKLTLGGGWLYIKRCSCRPYDWIEALYEYRRSLGKSARGQPLKLGYNAIYGKHAQRIGKPPFANPLYAGLTTALTRAKLNHAIVAAGARNVVMLATDGIYTVGRRPALARGDRLGEWEYKRHPSLFVVRPGLYWPPKPRGKAHAVKSRGLSAKFFEPMVGKFRRVWRTYIAAKRSRRGAVDYELAKLHELGAVKPIAPPVVAVPIVAFIGHRLALHRNKPELACRWAHEKRNQSFECHNGAKRSGQRLHRNSVVMGPRVGDPLAESASYQPGTLLATSAPLDEDRMLFEAMPDPVELSPPYSE